MKIRVTSRGETEFDAEGKHLEPAIREEAAAGDWEIVRSLVADLTCTEVAYIEHVEYATVTEDDGTELWSGWLDGGDRPAPDA
jgi:hypothetical protein